MMTQDETSLSHPNLKVTQTGSHVPERRATQFHSVAPDKFIGLHDNSIQNMRTAILQRVFYVKWNDGIYRPPPQPKAMVFRRRLKKFKQNIVSQLALPTPVSRIEYSMMYIGRKRQVRLAASETLERDEIKPVDARISTFGKVEKVLKKDAVQRIISSPDDRYKVELGRYLKPLEKDLTLAIDSYFGEQTIAKGMNADEIGQLIAAKWAKFDDPVGIILDATRFDQHCSVDALKWEFGVYNSICKSKELAKLLRWQLSITASGKSANGYFSYKIKGGRGSGQQNTSMGNCLLMCAMTHSLLTFLAIRKFSVINLGDDTTIIMERKHLDVFEKHVWNWFFDYGFQIKIEKPVFVLEHLEFCHSRPINVNGLYRMVRNVPDSFLKDSVSIKELTTDMAVKKWMRAVGEGGLALTAGVPLCQQFYNMLWTESDKISCIKSKSRRVQQRQAHGYSLETIGGGLYRLSMGMTNRNIIKSDTQTRVSFWEAFGFDEQSQLFIEQYYSTFKLNLGRSESHVPVEGIPLWELGAKDWGP